MDEVHKPITTQYLTAFRLPERHHPIILYLSLIPCLLLKNWKDFCYTKKTIPLAHPLLYESVNKCNIVMCSFPKEVLRFISCFGIHWR
jgi:hypothetical protein